MKKRVYIAIRVCSTGREHLRMILGVYSTRKGAVRACDDDYDRTRTPEFVEAARMLDIYSVRHDVHMHEVDPPRRTG